MKISEIPFGEIDAKYELVQWNSESTASYKETFYTPDNLKIDGFLNVPGKKHFITGAKGTGKTAILRYLSVLAEEKPDTATRFVLFKSDFSESQKSQFKVTSKVTSIEVDDNATTVDDYENVWKWYIFRQILELNNRAPVFIRNDVYDVFEKIVKSPKYSGESEFIKKLIPKIKKGQVEIGLNLDVVSAKLNLDLDWEKPQVDFSTLCELAFEIFKSLKPDVGTGFLLFDELELALQTTKQYTRDMEMIRDLIVSIEKINIASRDAGFRIKCIAAIRSEVKKAMESTGKEINKIIGSFATNLSWSQHSGEITEHPLLRLIEKRIRAGERLNGLTPSTSVWDTYFPEIYRNDKLKEYFLHLTWYRPRDVVRLMKMAADQFPDSPTIEQFHLDTIKKDYSTECWVEMIEELRARYSAPAANGLRLLMTGMISPFAVVDMEEAIKTKKTQYSDVALVTKDRTIFNLLEDLYSVGFIGNFNGHARFSFRGDDTPMFDQKFIIHKALKSYLSTQSRHD